MAKLIPIIAVPRSIMEQFLKSTQGMVQRRTWVKDSSGRKGHYRMQWVSPFDAGRGTSDHSKQFDLFGEPEPFEKPAEKPAPKAEPAAEMAPEWARLKEGLKFKSGDEVYTVHFERGEVRAIDSKGETKAGMNYKKADEKLTIADLRTFFTLPEGGEKEPGKPAAPAEDKSYPGLTNEEKMELVTSRSTLNMMAMQYKGEIPPNVRKEVSRLHDRIQALEAKIKEPEKPAPKPAKEEKAEEQKESGSIKMTRKEYNSKPAAYRGTFEGKPSILTMGKNGGTTIATVEFIDEKDPEKKPKDGDYKVYHDSFTGVVDEVIGHLGKQGLYMAENDVWNKISVGPGKPKDGRTDRYSMPLYDADGKPAGKATHFQVYDMGNGKYELNLYTSPLRKTEYEEDKVKVRKETGVTGEKPAEKVEGKADLTLTEQFINMGASVAVADGMWVDYYDSGRMKVVTKKIGNAAEAKKEAETFNREIESRTKYKREITNASGEAAMKRFNEATGNKSGKKPFDEMTFAAKKTTGKPSNVAETVRDVLDMSSGTASQFSGSAKVDDIDKFQLDAAKWAYENDKVGTGFDILGEYGQLKGTYKKEPVEEKRRPTMEEAAEAVPINDNQIVELDGEKYKLVPTMRGWRVYVGEGKYKGDSRKEVSAYNKAKILAEFTGARPSIGRMKELIRAVKAKGDKLYITADLAPRYKIGRTEAKPSDEVKKSLLDTFREGLSKALGGR